jgi:ABC-type phosphate transport system substrate-binding protein
MKGRLIAGLLSLALGLSGCGTLESTEATVTTATAAAATVEITTTSVETTATTTYITTTAAINEPVPYEEITLPIIDGSTSTIKLDAYIRAELLGISIQEASYGTKHSKTFEAFENLVNGNADIVLSVPLADEQKTYAGENNFEYETVPVALEGFVVLVNPENPVKSLTQEQIRKIYSGEITNWKELGGNDADIQPFQRNANSGSQTYMTEFMGETSLVDPPRTMVQLDMAGVISMFADYDNSIDAIGYSVYSYAAAFAASEGTFSFVAVDGIKPTRSTFFDGSYPLLSKTYAFYKKGTTDKVVLDYIDYITSDEGQQTILEAGYIPVSGIEIPTAYTLYEAKGTGKPAPENPDNKRYYYLDFESRARPRGFLKDTEFEAEIQNWIDEAIDKYFIESKPAWENTTDVIYYAEIKNGYLGISVGLNTCPGVGCYYEFYGSAAVFDLYEKKRVENLSDLFYKDIDFLPGINNTISAEIMNKSYGTPQKEFFGLCNGFSFDLDNINFQPGNAYFDIPASFYVTIDTREGSVVSECRDFTELLTADYAGKVEYAEYTKNTSPTGVYYEKNGHVYEFIDYPDVENDRELPENMMIEEMFDAYYERGGTEFSAPSPSVNGVFVELLTGFEGPPQIYCSLQHKFLSAEDFFKEGFIEHLTIDPEFDNPDKLTAEEIFNEFYTEHEYARYYRTSAIASQITEASDISYIALVDLRIDKTWLKDIYQNLPAE